MNATSIVTELDYEAALNEAAVYFDHPPLAGSPDAERFITLLSLIENYEAIHYPVDLPDPLPQAQA